MPQLGETVAEGKISKWFVSAGDAVKPGDNLFEIETDKVSMEVPAIAAGTLAAIHVQAGEVAPVGRRGGGHSGQGRERLLARQATKLRSPPRKRGSRARKRKNWIPACAGMSGARSCAPKPPSRWSRSARCARPSATTARRGFAGGTVVTPLARRLAGEAGIDLANVKGSGPHGRIVAADIEGAKRPKRPCPAPRRLKHAIVL